MIGATDAILRRILLDGVPGLTASMLSFQPPGEHWVQRVGTSTGVCVNVYLAEIEDDRKRRTNSNGPLVEAPNVRQTRAPERIQLTYFVSAWNAAQDTVANPATEAEHDTLSFILQALLRAAPFNASRVLPPAQLATVPEGMREVDLPTTIAPPEGHDKLSQFWGTMGKQHPHRPVIGVLVTVPVTYPDRLVTGVVLSINTDFAGDRLIEIGGHIRDARGAHAANPLPIAGATVVVRTLAGPPAARALAGADGSFVLDGLPPGGYQVTFTADGYPTPPAIPLTLPTPSGGSLELLFT